MDATKARKEEREQRMVEENGMPNGCGEREQQGGREEDDD